MTGSAQAGPTKEQPPIVNGTGCQVINTAWSAYNDTLPSSGLGWNMAPRVCLSQFSHHTVRFIRPNVIYGLRVNAERKSTLRYNYTGWQFKLQYSTPTGLTHTLVSFLHSENTLLCGCHSNPEANNSPEPFLPEVEEARDENGLNQICPTVCLCVCMCVCSFHCCLHVTLRTCTYSLIASLHRVSPILHPA